MRTYLSLFFFVFVYFSVFGQNYLVELPIDDGSIRQDIYPIDSSGFYVANFRTTGKANTVQKVIYRYNSDFELVHQYSLELDDRFGPLRSWNQRAGDLFLLYQKFYGTDLFLMHVKSDGTFEKIEIPLFETMLLKHFHVLEQKVILGGLFNSKPTFFTFNLENNRLSPFEGIYEDKSMVVQSKIDKHEKIISVLTSDIFHNKEKSYTLRNFDFDGKLLRTTILEAPDNKMLQSAWITNFKNGDQFVIGNYADQGVHGTTGVFVMKVIASGQQEYKFHPYYRMEGFYDYLPEKKANRILKRAKRSVLKKGKWSTNDEMTISEPQETEDFIHTIGAIDGRRYHLVFDSSQEQRAMVTTSYDRSRITWTNKNEFFTLGWTQYLKVSQTNENGIEFYTRPLELNELGENIEDIYISFLEHWYDGRILMGYTLVKNGRKSFAITSQKID